MADEPIFEKTPPIHPTRDRPDVSKTDGKPFFGEPEHRPLRDKNAPEYKAPLEEPYMGDRTGIRTYREGPEIKASDLPPVFEKPRHEVPQELAQQLRHIDPDALKDAAGALHNKINFIAADNTLPAHAPNHKPAAPELGRK